MLVNIRVLSERPRAPISPKDDEVVPVFIDICVCACYTDSQATHHLQTTPTYNGGACAYLLLYLLRGEELSDCLVDVQLNHNTHCSGRCISRFQQLIPLS